MQEDSCAILPSLLEVGSSKGPWFCGMEPGAERSVHRFLLWGKTTPPSLQPKHSATSMAAVSEQQLDEVRKIFRLYLQQRSQRQTPERFAILEEVYATDEHFDADTLYFRLKQKAIQVSRATVYNTLDLLLDCDLIVRHQFGNKQAKYERAYSYWQHDHMICMDCNQVFEFCDPRIQSIQEMVSDIFQFEVKHHALHFYGHCRREACPNRATVAR